MTRRPVMLGLTLFAAALTATLSRSAGRQEVFISVPAPETVHTAYLWANAVTFAGVTLLLALGLVFLFLPLLRSPDGHNHQPRPPHRHDR